MLIDKLSLLRHGTYKINEFVNIKLPSVGEIEEYGEQKYWRLVSNICSTSYDHRFMLDDNGIDYEDIDDFSMFCMVMPSLPIEDTKILFGDKLNFKEFKPMLYNDEPILYNKKKDLVISDITYELIVRFLRDAHGFKRNYKIAGNKAARRYRMVEERKKLEKEMIENEYSSDLMPLISALVNCSDFKYDYNTVWDLSIYEFFDAVNRIVNTVRVRNTTLGIYTGNIDSKSIPSQQLNWLGELKK